MTPCTVQYLLTGVCRCQVTILPKQCRSQQGRKCPKKSTGGSRSPASSAATSRSVLTPRQQLHLLSFRSVPKMLLLQVSLWLHPAGGSNSDNRSPEEGWTSSPYRESPAKGMMKSLPCRESNLKQFQEMPPGGGRMVTVGQYRSDGHCLSCASTWSHWFNPFNWGGSSSNSQTSLGLTGVTILTVGVLATCLMLGCCLRVVFCCCPCSSGKCCS